MQARCPRCSAVFMTDRSGLQFCPSCGQQVDVPADLGGSGGVPPVGGGGGGWGGPPPPGGMNPGAGGREDTPWERRAQLGAAQGFFETWKRTVVAPTAFWPTVKPNGSWTDALIYAWILNGIAVVIGLPFTWMKVAWFNADWMRNLPNADQMSPEMERAIRTYLGGGGTVGKLLIALVLYPLFLVIGAGLLHLSCMIFGCAKNGYYATLRAIAYGSAPQVISAIPCVGVLGGIYSIVLVVLGITSLQDTTTGRAAGAVIAPLVLLICCCCGSAAMLGGMLAGLLHANP